MPKVCLNVGELPLIFYWAMGFTLDFAFPISNLINIIRFSTFIRDISVFARMGNLLRSRLSAINSPLIGEVRGKGLLNAIVVNPHRGKVSMLH